ncbi:MAG: VOC family protein [Gemmatimonadaceae bacterium]|nr:VOC family protein [Gemmatimonadaceae bacterium]
MLGTIAQIAMVFHDVPAAAAYYRDVVGLPLQFETGGMAFFDAGGVRLMFTPPSSPEFDHPNSFLYFRVDGIEAVAATLVDRGVVMQEPPHVVGRNAGIEYWLAAFQDPEKNWVGLMEERPVP